MQITDMFTWPKLIYSVILIGLLLLFAKELYTLWFDEKVYIGKFQVYESGEAKAGQEQSFALQIIHWHNTLTQLFEQEDRWRKNTTTAKDSLNGNTGEASPDNTWWPNEVSPINDPKSALSDIEISVQGVNIKDLLTRLRQWVSPPNEITGIIQKNDKILQGNVVWKRGPAIGNNLFDNSRFYSIVGEADLSSLAFKVACGIIWAQVATRQKNLQLVPREEFCDWVSVWVPYMAMRQKSDNVGGISAEDVTKISQWIAFLDRLTAKESKYPEMYRLRADVIDLLPADQQQQEDIAKAQVDRLKYALLINAGTKYQTSVPKALGKDSLLLDIENVIRAQARPSIIVQEGKLASEVSETWKTQLQPYLAQVATADLATGSGYIVKNGQEAHGYFTGFVIAPGIVVTMDFALNMGDKMPAVPFKCSDHAYTGRFSFAATGATSSTEGMLEIDSVIYISPAKDRMRLLLLRVNGHDAAKNPPLQIQALSEKANANDFVNRYIFTMGYPAVDQRANVAFQQVLMNGIFNVKRIMPGMIRSIDPGPDGSLVRTITSDNSTTGGTSGGPVVDLQTGKVIGIHWGGKWTEAKEKFAYAQLFSDYLKEPGFPADVLQLVTTDIRQ